MTAIVAVGVIILLTVVALLGAASPYRRRAIPPVEPLPEPLEDRRLTLLISLRDLETARSTGAVQEAEYARLRTETEERIARVLRALDERAKLASPNGDGREPRARPRWSPARVGVVALVAVVALSVGLVPSLVRSLENRADAGPPIVGSGSITYFKSQVRLHPHDVSARLNLAARYYDLGDLGDAYDQYVAALALDPRNVEALTHIGILNHFAGRPATGLTYENRALAVDPTYPEALFYKGVILFRGLNRPGPAVPLFRAFLRLSPYGNEAEQARHMLAEAVKAKAAH